MSTFRRRLRELELQQHATEPLVERLAARVGCSPRELVLDARRIARLVGDASLEDGARLVAAHEGIDADAFLAAAQRLEQEVQA